MFPWILLLLLGADDDCCIIELGIVAEDSWNQPRKKHPGFCRVIKNFKTFAILVFGWYLVILNRCFVIEESVNETALDDIYLDQF